MTLYCANAGFDGGKIGNHAQAFVIVDGIELLLDPTIGLIARATFDEVVSGKPIPNHLVKRFRQHNDNSIDDFSDRVVGAVVFGGYRPRNILYYFASLSDYLAFTDEIAPLWSGDLTRLIRRFPTPASTSLRINLEHSGKGK